MHAAPAILEHPSVPFFTAEADAASSRDGDQPQQPQQRAIFQHRRMFKHSPMVQALEGDKEAINAYLCRQQQSRSLQQPATARDQPQAASASEGAAAESTGPPPPHALSLRADLVDAATATVPAPASNTKQDSQIDPVEALAIRLKDLVASSPVHQQQQHEYQQRSLCQKQQQQCQPPPTPLHPLPLSPPPSSTRPRVRRVQSTRQPSCMPRSPAAVQMHATHLLPFPSLPLAMHHHGPPASAHLPPQLYAPTPLACLPNYAAIQHRHTQADGSKPAAKDVSVPAKQGQKKDKKAKRSREQPKTGSGRYSPLGHIRDF